MIWGIADEIRRETPPQGGAVIDLTSSQPDEIYVLHELKTRQRHSMPSDAQARGTALQLCIYKQLWDSLTATSAAQEFPAAFFWETQGVDPSASFSVGFAADLCASLEPMGIGATTLSELLAHTLAMLARFPSLHEEMPVKYVLQPMAANEDGSTNAILQLHGGGGGGEVVVGREKVRYDGP